MAAGAGRAADYIALRGAAGAAADPGRGCRRQSFRFDAVLVCDRVCIDCVCVLGLVSENFREADSFGTIGGTLFSGANSFLGSYVKIETSASVLNT